MLLTTLKAIIEW